MNERMVMVAMQPRERLREALCERTCDLVRYLDDIESAELKSREITPQGLVRCVHFWRARVNVPAVLAPHFDTPLLEWTGRTEWRASDYESRWVVEPRVMKDSALCEGIMRLAPAMGGKGTRIDLDLAIADVEGPAGFRVIARSILSTHFRKLVSAATRLIEEA